MTATLADVKKVNGPCQRALKVRVAEVGTPLTYKKDSEERKSLAAAVTDGISIAKLICYDPIQFGRIKPGSTVTLRNIIVRDETLIITKSSRAFLSANLDVTEEILHRAKEIINPPVAKTINIKEGLASPPKKCISIQGQLVQVNLKNLSFS